jgi:peptidoglycan/LPS O-acetylase OafA/YrhL
MQSGDKPQRLGELDSLRGLAALAVVLHHLVLAFKPDQPPSSFLSLLNLHPKAGWAWWRLLDTLTPVHLLVAGREAVILFFVLSGFVLSIPLQKAATSYAPFAARRVCRIYLPYLGALALAVGFNAAFSTGGIPSLGSWFQKTWTLPVRWTEIRDHLVFIGHYDWMRFNTAFWSLVYEMRISLLFPLLMVPVRLGWKASVIAIATLTPAYLVFGDSTPLLAECGITLHYAGFFVLGALLARHRVVLAQWTAESSRMRLAVLAALCGALLNYGLLSRSRYGEMAVQCMVAAGAGLLIVLATGIPSWRSFLTRPLLRWLGAISYSLYLLHGTVLFSLIYLLYPAMGWRPVAAIYIPLSLAAAYGFHRLVERPSIRLSHRIPGAVPRSEARPPLAARM